MSRRRFFGVAAAAGLLTTAACSSNKPANGKPGGGAVTVKHKFGQTTVPSPPRRVISAGFTEQDDLLAVGIVPIAITNWWGDQPFGVWPWAQPKLGAAQPVLLNLDNGVQFDQIAALKPDLVVATNAGLDRDSYNRLSGIAPTIPQSGDDPFFEPWKDQANTIGLAVFSADQMKSLISAVDNKFSDVAKSNQQFKGKKVLLLQGAFYQDKAVAALSGWRTEFLTQMGLVVPDVLQQFAVDDHRAFIPRDQLPNLLSSADALIWTTESDNDQAALLIDPTVKELGTRNIFTGKGLSGAIAFSSPLSLPVVADQLPPMLSKVLT